MCDGCYDMSGRETAGDGTARPAVGDGPNGTNGVIDLENYETNFVKNWNVRTSCDSIHIWSG